MAGTLVVDTINTESNANLTLDPGSGNIVVEGNLNIETNQIATTASNRDIELAPHGTGGVELRGNSNPGTVKFNCEDNSHAVTVRGPAHSAAANYTLTLPTSDGGENECLISNGSGVTSWSARAATGSTNTFAATQSVTPDDGTSDTTLDMSLSNFIQLGETNITGDPTNLVVGTSGLFHCATAAPTGFHNDFKFPGGDYTAPTSFPAIAPWYIAAENTILVGSWTEDIKRNS